jgi:hypothetical protein
MEMISNVAIFAIAFVRPDSIPICCVPCGAGPVRKRVSVRPRRAHRLTYLANVVTVESP